MQCSRCGRCIQCNARVHAVCMPACFWGREAAAAGKSSPIRLCGSSSSGVHSNQGGDKSAPQPHASCLPACQRGEAGRHASHVHCSATHYHHHAQADTPHPPQVPERELAAARWPRLALPAAAAQQVGRGRLTATQASITVRTHTEAGMAVVGR